MGGEKIYKEGDRYTVSVIHISLYLSEEMREVGRGGRGGGEYG
jgi:hypothetical protein